MINRNYKDTVFRMLFGREESKENALELYNALAETSYTDLSELELNVIENAVYMGYKNDVSFVFRNEMHLWEEQSSYNPNMPVRGLTYFSKLYSKYLTEHRINVFTTAQRMLPTPRYFVFYLGTDEQPEKKVLRLTDAFDRPELADVEVKATMLNINCGHNREILEKCRALRDYTELIQTIRVHEETMYIDDAIEAAVDECIERGILKEFLVSHKAEVKEMFALEYHEEITKRDLREQAIKEGLEEGRAEGRAKGLEEGHAKGLEEGRAELAALLQQLKTEGRTEEFDRVLTDEAYRNELLQKRFGVN
ncbi:MAG: hypothetical protein IJ121_00090 [Eubacterium sp.]|nr:hypothetical protein [Eubacterium sp.]